jgi:hypothetical protein
MPTGKERQNNDIWRGLAESGTPKIKTPPFAMFRSAAFSLWVLGFARTNPRRLKPALRERKGWDTHIIFIEHPTIDQVVSARAATAAFAGAA